MKEDNYDVSREFDTIWKNVEEIVVSQVIADIHNPVSSILNIQSTYDDLIARWTHKHSHEQVWLDAIHQKDPNKAERVLQCAKSLRLKQASKRPMSKWPFRIFKALIVLFLFFLLPIPYIPYIGNFVELIVWYTVVSACSRPLIRRLRANREKSIVDEYRDQLAKTYNEITKLLQ